MDREQNRSFRNLKDEFVSGQKESVQVNKELIFEIKKCARRGLVANTEQSNRIIMLLQEEINESHKNILRHKMDYMEIG